jgi:hypothetical protein
VNLVGQLAIQYMPKDLVVEPLPQTYRVHGANGQEVALTGSGHVPFMFVGPRGLKSQEVIVRAAIAPEFKGALLLSKHAMQRIGVTIELRQPRSLIHLRR